MHPWFRDNPGDCLGPRDVPQTRFPGLSPSPHCGWVLHRAGTHYCSAAEHLACMHWERISDLDVCDPRGKYGPSSLPCPHVPPTSPWDGEGLCLASLQCVAVRELELKYSRMKDEESQRRKEELEKELDKKLQNLKDDNEEELDRKRRELEKEKRKKLDDLEEVRR